MSEAPGSNQRSEQRQAAASVGVLLMNLGTPASPAARDVRRYLREFLSDPLVLDMHPVARAMLLYGVILPFRPRRAAAAYRQIWTDDGSPLLVESKALRDAVAERLGAGFHVELAMRYGEPSIAGALGALCDRGLESLLVLPLFPQYADASTGTAVKRVEELLEERRARDPQHRLTVKVLPAFYDHPGFIQAWVDVCAPLSDFGADHVLFSYHGLPERQIRKLDASGAHCLETPDCCDRIGSENGSCYRAHCFATSRALVLALELEPGRSSNSFQSRLGRTPWITPFTDKHLPELYAKGVRRLAVLCPSFVADCLETLEEVQIRLRAQWLGLGGEDLWVAPCPNADPAWAETVCTMLREQAGT